MPLTNQTKNTGTLANRSQSTTLANEPYLQFTPGTFGTGRVKTTHNNRHNPVGNLELLVRASFDDNDIQSAVLFSKWTATNNQRTFRLIAATTGVALGANEADRYFSMTTSDDGSLHDAIFTSDTINIPIDTKFWVRTTVDITNGVNSVGQLYYSLDDVDDPSSVSWTQIGTDLTDDIISPTINATTTPGVCIGANDSAAGVNSAVFNGKVYYAEAIDDIGSFIRVTPEHYRTATTSFVDEYGNTFSVAGAAEIVTPLNNQASTQPTTNYLSCAGTVSSYAWSGAKSVWNITGDLDIIARVQHDLDSVSVGVIAGQSTNGTSKSVSSLTRAAGAGTVTATAVCANHGLTTGDYVTITGASGTSLPYNSNQLAAGFALVTVTDRDTFTYSMTGGTSPTTAVGTISMRKPTRVFKLIITGSGSNLYTPSLTIGDIATNYTGAVTFTADDYVVTDVDTPTWYRVTLDLTNGSNSVATFYYSYDSVNEPSQVTWVQVGSQITGTSITTFATSDSAQFRIGCDAGVSANGFDGKIFYTSVTSGGQEIFTLPFYKRATSSTTTTDENGYVWNLTSAPVTSGTSIFTNVARN